MENNDTPIKNDNDANSPEERPETQTEEAKIEAIAEPEKKPRINLLYIPAGFLVAVGSLIAVYDIYNLVTSYTQYLSLYQISFWDLQFSDQYSFVVYIFKYVALGMTQIVVGFLLYAYAKNKGEAELNAP
jgi:hypothetical protein